MQLRRVLELVEDDDQVLVLLPRHHRRQLHGKGEHLLGCGAGGELEPGLEERPKAENEVGLGLRLVLLNLQSRPEAHRSGPLGDARLEVSPREGVKGGELEEVQVNRHPARVFEILRHLCSHRRFAGAARAGHEHVLAGTELES